MIVEKLKKKGLIEKIDEDYTHNIAINSRGGGIIEPQIREQWFVNVNSKFKIQNSKLRGISSGAEITLKEIMRKVVETGQIKILPKRFEKIYFHWIDNLRDWNISRQIWFGHRVPVWYKRGTAQNERGQDAEETYVGTEPPKGSGWEQDLDTLDTWFSSGLWTFSTLGWPEDTKDLEIYHPTDVLETGYDILFFWVARMILTSGYLLGDIPFRTVYLHGMVRDEQGRKMSKSLGNAVDPLDLIEKFGTDALRMAMIVGVGPGSDVVLGEYKIKAYKHFANKIWNAARFVIMSLGDDFDSEKEVKVTSEDKKLLKELDDFVKEVTDKMESYRFHLASEKLYHYFWHTFADKIIEAAKPRLESKNNEDALSARATLFTILTTTLKLLHPFIPYVTEAIWQQLPIKNKNLLMVEAWPDLKS